MVLLDPKPPLREDLQRFIKDQRTLKAFEKIFELIPSQLNLNLELLEEALDAAASAESNAINAIALVYFLKQMVETVSLQNNCECQRQDDDFENSSIHQNQIDDIGNAYVLPRILSLDALEFDLNHPHLYKVGRLAWDMNDDTLNLGHSGGVIQQIGEELYARVTNSTGSTITNGQFVGLIGSGTAVAPYIANGSAPPMYAVGVATQDILNGQRGRLTVWGRVRGFDTSAWSVGTILYSSPSVAGGLTNIKPTAPNLVIPVGVVTVSDASNGEIFVRPIIEQQLYYGSFLKTANASPASINTAYAITFDTTQVSNGISVGTPTSRIVAANSGLYSFNVSFQVKSGSASAKTIWFWFRKNGVDIANSSLKRSFDSNNITTQTRSQRISMNAGDYVEVMWASDDTNVSLEYTASTAFAPAAPSCVLSVEQIQQ
ncbi:hypothetical protein AYL20_01275 [Acinetobacter venetianus]|uniref:capsid cement protein n=1 Tax=Acinetobacter venetianus TaxID=52133 RepID=UPI000775C469|nr:capsid cement protein [Acinetobacter venetianus]KXO82655.1 hypothetical protein AYL20_01275 [Acinetobacter venetianus]